MSSIKLSPNASGTGEFTISAPNSNTNRTLSLPDQTGTVLTNAGPFTANASASAGAVTIDASNNVGIGTSSPGARLQVTGSVSNAVAVFDKGGANQAYTQLKNSSQSYSTYVDINNNGTNWLAQYDTTNAQLIDVYVPTSYRAFYTANTERARIDSSGRLMLGTTSTTITNSEAKYFDAADGMRLFSGRASTASREHILFQNPNGTVGSISTSGSATTYSTSSDYRLKEAVAPMTGALAKVAALKPVTYKWKVDGSDGQGFIAHELAEVEPGCVTGEKDAVDAEGNPVYQGIDTSFLVATLTAAIQELNAKVEAQAAEIAALKGVQ